MGNGGVILAKEKGSVRLRNIGDSRTKDIVLTDVLYCPQLGTNLLSVQKLRLKGCEVFFTRDGYTNITDENDEWIGTAPLHDGLYRLQTSVVKDPNSKLALAKRALATSTVKPLPLYLWHRRLRHLNTASVRTLSKMLDDVKIAETDTHSGAEDRNLCIACLEGKQSRTYNKEPSPRATRPLELLHSDSCGPFETLSIAKYKYFIIFVDDDTHYVWVFFLKTKSSEEILQVFRQFKALVEKSTGLSIARFRCDNGKGEYDNHQFKYFLAESGISFEPSAPYNQDQNGVSERMKTNDHRKGQDNVT